MEEKKELFGLDDSFEFDCHPGLECFTTCCADVTIFLTPYDSLHLARHLGLSSSDFLAEYTVALRGPRPVLPLVALKMAETEGRPCRLVTPKGCSAYEARPWACRMFPLDLIGREDFRLLEVRGFCRGLAAGQSLKVRDYLTEQGVGDSLELDAAYNEITGHPALAEMDVDNPKVARMVYLACYDLDRFREMIFESSFLDKFEVEPRRLERIRLDQVELLKFGFDWVKFGLFGEKTLDVKQPAEAADAPGR